MITDYHAKYFAFELTRRFPSDSVQKLFSSLSDAQVDLNPHQVEAALFAFQSPLSKGALLADEVGLGKTITAGMVLKECIVRGFVKRALILTPPSLVNQWKEELSTKFDLKFKSFNVDFVTRIFSSNFFII